LKESKDDSLRKENKDKVTDSSADHSVQFRGGEGGRWHGVRKT
jgi:hypothetical protein